MGNSCTNSLFFGHVLLFCEAKLSVLRQAGSHNSRHFIHKIPDGILYFSLTGQATTVTDMARCSISIIPVVFIPTTPILLWFSMNSSVFLKSRSSKFVYTIKMRSAIEVSTDQNKLWVKDLLADVSCAGHAMFFGRDYVTNVCVGSLAFFQTPIKTTTNKILLFLSNWKSTIMRKTAKKEAARRFVSPILRTVNENVV